MKTKNLLKRFIEAKRLCFAKKLGFICGSKFQICSESYLQVKTSSSNASFGQTEGNTQSHSIFQSQVVSNETDLEFLGKNYSAFPQTAYGLLQICFLKGETLTATGVLVAPDLVLTAAQSLYHKKTKQINN